MVMTLGEKNSGPLLPSWPYRKTAILVQMNETGSMTNLPHFGDSKTQISSHCNTSETRMSYS